MKVCIYHSHYHRIGGVETSTFNLCKLLSDYYDVTLIFGTCDAFEKVLDLPCRILKFDPENQYEFDVVILESCWGIIPINNLHAKKIIQIIHADFKKLDQFAQTHCLPNVKHLKITHYVAVGQNVKETFEDLTGIKIDKVIYNIVC
jgi:glycosyltransferase involved in cell wall biosynthesis